MNPIILRIKRNFILNFFYSFLSLFPGQLAEGLAGNDLDHYSHLLTGYVGSASFLKRIAQLVPILKQKNPNLIYGINLFISFFNSLNFKNNFFMSY